LTRSERVGVVGPGSVVQAVPHGEGRAEVALPADEPVSCETADPVLVPAKHVVGHPAQPAAQPAQLVAKVRAASAIAAIPLPRADYLQWTVAPLIELHRVDDRARLADERAGRPEQLRDPVAGGRNWQTLNLTVSVSVHTRWRRIDQPAVTSDYHPRVEVEV